MDHDLQNERFGKSEKGQDILRMIDKPIHTTRDSVKIRKLTISDRPCYLNRQLASYARKLNSLQPISGNPGADCMRELRAVR